MKKKTTIVLNQLFFYKIYSGTNVKNYPTSLYMFEYILKINKNINFIDLEKTFYLLKKALKIIHKLSKKKILFVENTFINSNLNIISSTAKACNKKYITEEWKGGIISNFKSRKRSEKINIIIKRIKYLPHLILLFNGYDTLIINEVYKKKIPIICFTNTYVNSRFLTYRVPWNDNSVYSTFLICKLIYLTITHSKIKK